MTDNAHAFHWFMLPIQKTRTLLLFSVLPRLLETLTNTVSFPSISPAKQNQSFRFVNSSFSCVQFYVMCGTIPRTCFFDEIRARSFVLFLTASKSLHHPPKPHAKASVISTTNIVPPFLIKIRFANKAFPNKNKQ